MSLRRSLLAAAALLALAACASPTAPTAPSRNDAPSVRIQADSTSLSHDGYILGHG